MPERFDSLPSTPYGDGLVVFEARSHRARRKGLSRLDSMPDNYGLHIPQCPAVHTIGMRFALDLIWLRPDGSVARVDRDVAPWRMRICPKARSVIETNAGQADAFVAAGVAGEHSARAGDAEL